MDCCNHSVVQCVLLDLQALTVTTLGLQAQEILVLVNYTMKSLLCIEQLVSEKATMSNQSGII